MRTREKRMPSLARLTPIICFAVLTTASVWASSHREALFITELPKVDGTDFYMFTSYEPGRQGFVTVVANYLPLQDPYGGPNYFSLDPDAIYEIHFDNDGDAKRTSLSSFGSRTIPRTYLSISDPRETPRAWRCH